MQEKAEKWPSVVKRGGAEVKIYCIKNRGRQAYQVVYHLAGKRRLKNFAKLNAARTHANEQATLLNSGHHAVAAMHDHDREAYVAAVSHLKKVDVPLLDAVKGYVAAVQALPPGASLLDAAKEYAARHPVRSQSKGVPEVVEAFFKAKLEDGASANYLRTLRYHLMPLSEHFRMPISDVTSQDLDGWVRSLGRTPRTRRNVAVTLTTLFRFARSVGYLPKHVATEAEGVTRPKSSKGGRIEILTPNDLATILHAADTDARRIYFALGAFTGIRAAELSRLDWEEINLAGGHVEVAAHKAKTASRRLVPISSALAAWLAPYAARRGRIFSSQREAERLVEWAGKQIGRWPGNCLRHSYISYRLAQTQDMGRTALEAGNSQAIIFSNYRELVTPADAEKWFAITPDRPSNGVPIVATRA